MSCLQWPASTPLCVFAPRGEDRATLSVTGPFADAHFGRAELTPSRASPSAGPRKEIHSLRLNFDML